MALANDTEAFHSALEVWRAIEDKRTREEAHRLQTWAIEIHDLQRLESDLKRAGRWVRGPSDLLGVLGIEHKEVLNCRVLAWLLDPIGAHGYGALFLRSFLSDIGRLSSAAREIQLEQIHETAVITEETKDDTRADVVIYGEGWTVLIEAKIRAGEQPEQGRRLEEGWSDSDPICVFLTRGGKEMGTAVTRKWIPYKWSEVARCLRSALDESNKDSPNPLPREYIRSMELHLS